MALKYKVGDRVKIKSLDWYNENKDKDGIVELSTHVFVPGMSEHCGTIVTIEDVFEDIDNNVVYYMKELDWDWTDEMIEGLVEAEVGLVDNFSSRWVNEFNLPDGYIFKDENGNVINATKIVLEKKKKEYPKTLKECRRMLDIDSGCLLASYDIGFCKYELLDSLQKLLICRDTYWNIAGEEMGLGKPWEPDWRKERYIIYWNQDDIIGGYREAGCVEHHIFEFPTAEMRDAFKENFDKDIEICKKLL